MDKACTQGEKKGINKGRVMLNSYILEDLQVKTKWSLLIQNAGHPIQKAGQKQLISYRFEASLVAKFSNMLTIIDQSHSTQCHNLWNL